MTTYVIAATPEARRYIILSRRHPTLRFTEVGNVMTIEVTWPQVLADRWRAYILSRWGV